MGLGHAQDQYCQGVDRHPCGDPQANGPTFPEFPTVPITLNGFQYHFQDLVMLPWWKLQKDPPKND